MIWERVERLALFGVHALGLNSAFVQILYENIFEACGLTASVLIRRLLSLFM
jgi:hypothetical protein